MIDAAKNTKRQDAHNSFKACGTLPAQLFCSSLVFFFVFCWVCIIFGVGFPGPVLARFSDLRSSVEMVAPPKDFLLYRSVDDVGRPFFSFPMLRL